MRLPMLRSTAKYTRAPDLAKPAFGPRRLLLAGGAAVLLLAMVPTRADAASASSCPTAVTPPPGGVVWGQLCQVVGGAARLPQGVLIAVSRNGKPVGKAKTDEHGVFAVPIPGPGRYGVSLDRSTLPRGFSLAGRSRLSLDVFLDRQRVVFPLGPAVSTGRSLGDVLEVALTGLRSGLIIAMGAAGLSLLYRVAGIVNLAHGEFLTVGAITAYAFHVGLGLPLVVAAVLSAAVIGGFGFGLDLGLWRPLRRRGVGFLGRMVITIGLALILHNTMQLVFGVVPRQYHDFQSEQPLHLGSVSVLPRDLAVDVIAIAVLVALTLTLRHTTAGTSIRAVSDNPDLAEGSGINVSATIRHVWALAAALAAAAGVMQGVALQVDINMGAAILLSMFAAIVLGGAGSWSGAIAGGLVIGFAEEISTLWLPSDFKLVLSLVVLILVLLVRPQGILAPRTRMA